MRWKIAAIITVGCCTIPAVASAPLTYEAAVLVAMNAARNDPAGYARSLRDYRANYRGRLLLASDQPFDILTEEGPAPLDEAVQYLQSQPVQPAFGPSDLLAEAAADHVAEQEAGGDVGHIGRDGTSPGDRVRRRGGGIYVGEVIAYGPTGPADVVRQLIIDDGVPDRGHRRLLFDRNLRFAGVSCGRHPVYRTMCVIDLARTDTGKPPVMTASLR